MCHMCLARYAQLLATLLSPTSAATANGADDGGALDLAALAASEGQLAVPARDRNGGKASRRQGQRGGLGRGAHARLMTSTRQTVFASATVPQRAHFTSNAVTQFWSVTEPLVVHVTPAEVRAPTTRGCDGGGATARMRRRECDDGNATARVRRANATTGVRRRECDGGDATARMRRRGCDDGDATRCPPRVFGCPPRPPSPPREWHPKPRWDRCGGGVAAAGAL